MDKRMAGRLARRIERDAPDCSVTGSRRYGPGDYSLDVVDIRTGVPFEVTSPEAWQQRMQQSWQDNLLAIAMQEPAIAQLFAELRMR